MLLSLRLSSLALALADGEDNGWSLYGLLEESFFFLVVVGVEPVTLHMLSKCSTTELFPQPSWSSRGGLLKL